MYAFYNITFIHIREIYEQELLIGPSFPKSLNTSKHGVKNH